MRRNLLLFVLIFWEISIILVLLVRVTHYSSLLGSAVEVSPIKNNEIIYSPSEILHHYYEPKPNSTLYDRDEFTEYVPIYKINSDSLNENKEYSVEKPQDVFRIIALGDSFTFGHFANTNDNYVEVLEQKLNELNCEKYRSFEVLNLGVKGYDIQYSVERFIQRGKKYNPDLVIWLLKDDDFIDVLDLTYEAKAEVRRVVSKDAIRSLHSDQGNFSVATGVVAEQLKQLFGEKSILEYQKSMFKSLNEKFQGSLFIFTFPITKSEYKNLLIDVAASRDKTLFSDNLTNIYSQNAFLPDKHPNLLGYRLIAEFVYKEITTNGLINCK